MWFAALDGLVLGALVALAALRPLRRDGSGSTEAVLTLGIVGGLVGGLLGFALVSGSTSSGPLQIAPIIVGTVGAAAALAVLRGWVIGGRRAVLTAAAAVETAAAARAEEQRVAARRATRGPSPLGELVVAALVVLRGRGRG